ncbi:filamentous hemagglutinin N-terminal domain-containing protein [Nostoc sp. NMS9]|uniref:two-partner secretion domain-containing protein n=1 Tax=Nostoc sp. NMS9 TaxID=2815393 RepID=UPI0025E73FEC|nr:filamentous hemagglutinin N-terminal domain-containing protein [Nostoc sp. NMS9]MBN3939973.1 filamentous hemagglutinin N-terminal domain-containing protein [Nostoc sp. NMS9]
MNKSRSNWYCKLGLVSALGISGVLTFFGNSALAQIIKDNTLGSESSVVTHKIINDQPTEQIDGGTTRGTNLFHSFEQFSVLTGSTAYFNNAANIQNIISRVTGKSFSNIDGIIKANGSANLFLINPNGIVFGPNASLNIGGSFVGSTGSSLNFADGTKFSATDPKGVPLLTVSVPIGLQFGATAAPIRNQSQANPDGVPDPVGLQVGLGKTLALVGGDITLEGGNLTAPGGRIELGSVTANSLVSLNSTNQSLILGYENVQNFQDIQLIQRQNINGTGVPSQVDASGDGGGNIQVQGNTVELIGNLVRITTRPTATGNGGDLTINTTKLIVRDGAQVYTSSITKGNGGNLTVNASESVELIGGFFSPNMGNRPSSLFSSTGFAGNAGDITINTKRLYIQDGANISTQTLANSQLIAATGAGGNLTVNASESVELIGTSVNGYPSGLFAATNGSGDAGKLKITTGKLIIQDRAELNVSSKFEQNFTYPGDAYILGKAGDLNVTARSILLNNAGKLTSNSDSGRGGDISLQVRDFLQLRRNSQITTNAGGKGDGGNIFINVPNSSNSFIVPNSNTFIVAVPNENSDISASAVGGNGGNVKINALDIIGTQYREDPTNYSDITASSEFGLNGTVQINSPDVDPSKGLVELPVNLVDASQQIAASCSSGGKIARNSFIITGRGGLVADPTEPLIADDAVLADWITLSPHNQNRAGGIQKRAVVQAQRNTEEKSQKVNSVNEPTQIVEAQGWVMDANGNVILVAQVPTATHNSSLTSKSCPAN